MTHFYSISYFYQFDRDSTIPEIQVENALEKIRAVLEDIMELARFRRVPLKGQQ
jgi:hypothetical protein